MPPSKKPAARVMAEGLVIVVSILLALAADAWWDSRQEARERVALLIALRADFEETASHLEQFQQMNQAALAASDSILGLLYGRSGVVDVPVATVVTALRPPTPDPPVGALEALLSSGGLSLIEDGALQRALAAWPAALGDLQSKADLGQSMIYERLLPGLSSRTEVSDLIEGRMNQVMTSRPGVDLPAVQDRGTMGIPATSAIVGMFEERRLFATLLRGNNWLHAQRILGEIHAGLDRNIR